MPVTASPNSLTRVPLTGLISCKPATARLEIFVRHFSQPLLIASTTVGVFAFCANRRLFRLRQERRHYAAPASSDDALKARGRKGLTGIVASDGPK